MSIRQINQCKQSKSTAIAPCYNCAAHNFIFFQRIKIDNFKCIQKGKCQICKFEWVEFWYVPMQKQFFNSQSNNRSNKHKEIIRQSEEMTPQWASGWNGVHKHF